MRIRSRSFAPPGPGQWFRPASFDTRNAVAHPARFGAKEARVGATGGELSVAIALALATEVLASPPT